MTSYKITIFNLNLNWIYMITGFKTERTPWMKSTSVRRINQIWNHTWDNLQTFYPFCIIFLRWLIRHMWHAIGWNVSPDFLQTYLSSLLWKKHLKPYLAVNPVGIKPPSGWADALTAAGGTPWLKNHNPGDRGMVRGKVPSLFKQNRFPSIRSNSKRSIGIRPTWKS